jgi:hypothetical protein
MYAVLAFLVTAAVVGTRADDSKLGFNRTVLVTAAVLLTVALTSRRVL